MAGPYADAPAAAQQDARRRARFQRVFSAGDGLAALHDILAMGGVIDRGAVFPGDTGMMLAERQGRRDLALEILDLSGAALALEPGQAPSPISAAPGQSSETGGHDGQGESEA